MLPRWWKRKQAIPSRLPEVLPRHVAIIMDGNGRWAKQRGLPRLLGHREGMEALRRVVRACGELGIPMLTVYAFSTENWRRPREEVDGLMSLLREYLRQEIADLQAQHVSLGVIGDIDRLPERVGRELGEAVAQTSRNRGLRLNLALNYGGRQEILMAARRIAEEVASGRLKPSEVDEKRFARALYTAQMPDPDLIIRCSGEFRLSNFLLWQAAYSELYVTPVLWPDFRREHLLAALEVYARRERRFGGLSVGRT